LPPRGSRFGSPLVLSRVHWVRPELVVEVSYAEWTPEVCSGMSFIKVNARTSPPSRCAVTRLAETDARVERPRQVLEHLVSDIRYDRSRHLSLRLGNRKDAVMEATATEAPAATQMPTAQPTIGGSVYVKPQDIAWEPTQFEHFDQGPLRGQAEGRDDLPA